MLDWPASEEAGPRKEERVKHQPRSRCCKQRAPATNHFARTQDEGEEAEEEEDDEDGVRRRRGEEEDDNENGVRRRVRGGGGE